MSRMQNLTKIFYLYTDRVSNDGQVLSGPLNFGLSDRKNEVALEDLIVDLEGRTVHQLVLENNNWVGITNSRLK